MNNDTSAPLHICPDCVNRVNGDPAPEPGGWEYTHFRAKYGPIDTTDARYVEEIDSHTGGCELCMSTHIDGLREVWAAPLTNTNTAPLTTHEEVPIADSPEDVLTRTIPLDGGTAIVEHVENRVELTIRLGERIVCGLALTALEAAAIGRALHSPDGATTGDLLHLADTLGVNAGDIMRLSGTTEAV